MAGSQEKVMTFDRNVEMVRWTLYQAANVIAAASDESVTHQLLLEVAETELWKDESHARDHVVETILQSAAPLFSVAEKAGDRMPRATECDFIGFELPDKGMVLQPKIEDMTQKNIIVLMRWILWTACQRVLAAPYPEAVYRWRDEMKAGGHAAAELCAFCYLSGVNLAFGDWSPQDVQRRNMPKELLS